MAAKKSLTWYLKDIQKDRWSDLDVPFTINFPTYSVKIYSLKALAGPVENPKVCQTLLAWKRHLTLISRLGPEETSLLPWERREWHEGGDHVAKIPHALQHNWWAQTTVFWSEQCISYSCREGIKVTWTKCYHISSIEGSCTNTSANDMHPTKHSEWDEALILLLQVFDAICQVYECLCG